MAEDKHMTIGKIVGKINEQAGKAADFKRMLITIVNHELVGWYENKMWHWAARGVLVIGDLILQELLLREIMKEEDLSKGRYEAPGRLAVAIGNIALAEQILEELTETIGEKKSDNAIVNIVITMPYETTARRFMHAFEERGDCGRALNIASAIEDQETSARLISQMFNQGRIFPNIEAALLTKAVLYKPELGKLLVRQLINIKEVKEQYMEHIGLMAAALGDKEAAESAFRYLKEGGEFDKLQAAKIAAALGNLSDAEEIVSAAYRRNAKTYFVEGDRLFCDSLGDIIGSTAKQNIGAAERMWRQVTWSATLTFIPMAAVRVLEVIK